MSINAPRIASRTRVLRRTAALPRLIVVASVAFLLLMIVSFAAHFRVANTAPTPFPNTSSTVFINEFHYDNTGTDANEFIEVAAPAGTNMANYSIVLYNGATGLVYDTDALTGTTTNQQGGYGTVSLAYPANGIQNGSPDGIALINTSTDTLVQFLCYEGTFVGSGGLANGVACTDIGVSQPDTTVVGASLQLQGTGTTYGDFTWGATTANTKDAANTGQTFTGGGGDSAPSVTNTSPANGATNVLIGSNISITFSESVNATVNSFSVECPTNSPQSFSLSSSPATTFTLDPTADLPGNTTCTVTVVADQITDTDTDDPPDIMTSDFVFSFMTAATPPPVATNVIINELDSDTPGTDAAEFVELYDGGVGNTSLTGLVLVFYNGSDDLSYRSIDLDGFTTNASGYFTAGNAAVPGVDFVFPGNILQNGADAVALYVADAASFPNGTPVTTASLQDAVVYDTADPDDPGLLVLLNAGQPQVDENSGGNGDTVSIGRCPNGSGGHRNTTAYTARTPTPDTVNNCPPPPVPAAIHDIQGTGASSPFVGQSVITTGIVTARKSNGFFIQEPDATVDADPNTSEGIFVFSSKVVAVGDALMVTGPVLEFFNLTQVSSSPSNVVISSSGNLLPTPIVLTTTILNPAGPPDQLERFEGMRMHADSLTSVAPTNNFAETFTVLTGVARPMREPGIEISLPVPPDPTSGVPDCCIPRWDENPERIMIDSDGLVGSSVISVTSNVTFTNVTGPLDFSFGDYKILPETTPTTTANMSAVPVPTPVAGEFAVAGFNIENFNNGETQRKKAALAIRTVLHYPDVIGHIEISNLTSLQALADQVNADAIAAGDPNPIYEAQLIPAPAGGTQNVGFLVKTARVQIDSVTQERADETFINPNNGMPETLHDRPPLVLQATVDPSGINPRQVIIIVNHLRSFIDIELVAGDGPRVRAKRKAQAESLADLLQDLQTAHPTLAIISIGDYNAYQFNDGYTDPISVIKGTPTADDEVVVDQSPDLVNPNFTNLTDGIPVDQRYSFIFEGTPQALDHVIVNSVANSYVQRYAVARNNSDFPEAFFGDVTRPERNSDHDMPVAYFAFPPPSADLSISKTATPSVAAGSNITYSITVTNNGISPAQNVVVSDNLPAGTTFVSCNSTGAGVCGGTGNNRTVTFSSMANGASATITIVASVNCDVPNGQILNNTATVSSDTDDPDSNNNSQAASTTVSNPPPTITGVSVDKPVLWPPNHQMVDVTVNYGSTDTCGAVICTLSVTSNEPVNGEDDGNTSPDWVVVDNHHVRLRAERSGSGTGRVYTITITCTDAAGGTTIRTATVSVPISMD